MKKTTKSTMLIIMLISLSLSTFASNIRNEVVTIPDKIWKKSQPKGDDVEVLKHMINLNNRYTLNSWYCDITKFDSQTEKYIDFGGKLEPNIRPTSHNVFVLAMSLKLPIYDSETTQASRERATEVLKRLIESSTYRHKANNPDKEAAWGDHWQSAMWSAQIALGAWIIWDELTPEVQEMVARMTEHEADRFLDSRLVLYYQDRDGNIISEGNTRAEENAWNSNMVTMALLMMPNHKNHDAWLKTNIELQISAYARPSDLNSRKVVDGYVVEDLLQGSNANEDGTVVNHKILHPDYMTAIMFNTTNDWTYKLAGVKPLESSIFNVDVTYNALTNNLYNGKTMYQPTADGKASIEIYFPEGNDWGGERQANYWLMDIIADAYGVAKKDKIKPMEWAHVRLYEMLRMMNRDTTGQYYQSQTEDKFFSREQWIGQHLAWGYIGLWID